MAAIDSTVLARTSRSGPIRFRYAAESESLSRRRARAEAEEGVPARFRIHAIPETDMHDPEAGAIYVVDRGHVDFARLYVLHQAGAFFVTRAKSNIDAHRVYSAPTDRSTGIICDQTISLDGFYTRQDYPELLRRIRFKDPESGKTLVFITNNFSLPAATICALYKSRWQVEL